MKTILFLILLVGNPERINRDATCVLWLGHPCNSQLMLIVAALGSVVALLQPFVEEPWLRKRFGAAYDLYTREVPRFLPRFSAAQAEGGS